MLSRSERIKLTRPIFAAIWQCFSLDSTPAPAFTANGHGRAKDAKELQEVAEGVLNRRDLCNLLTYTIDHQILSTDEVEKKLLLAVNTARSLVCTMTLNPFVSLVLGQKFDRGKKNSATDQPSPESVVMVTTILQRFVHTCVGKEPQQAGNWTQPTGTCNCAECSKVNAVFRSPTKRMGMFKLSKQRRHHLHNIFNSIPGAPCTIETLRTTYPKMWQIKKINEGQDAHKAWKDSKTNAEAKLRELRSVGPLDLYLGGVASVILAMDVDQIARNRRKQGAETAVQPDVGARHLGSVERRGTKRAAMGDTNEVEGANKAKPNTPTTDFVRTERGLVEVVDLT